MAAVRGLEGDATELAVLGELDRHLEPEHPQVPLRAGADVADRDLDVVDRCEVGHVSPFTRADSSESLE